MTPVGTQSNATIQTNYQNGLSAVNFAGINVYRSVNGTGVYPSDVYILVALKSLVRMDVIAIGTTTGGGNFNSLTFGEHTALRWHNGSDFFNRTPLMVSPTNETSTSLLLMNWSLANNNFVIRRNGVQLVTTASYTYTLTAPSSIQIGFRHTELTSTTLPLNAFVAEVLAYNRQLDLAERQQVEGYLANKWGLQANLPATHPFRTLRPAMRIFSPFDGVWPTLWLDAADATTFTLSGTNVTQWRDKSGSSNHYSNVGTVTYQSNGVSLNGSSYLRNSTVSGFPFGATPALSTFIVCSIQTVTSVSTLFDYGNVSCSKTGYVLYFDTPNVLFGTLYCGDLNVNTPITTNTPLLISDVITYTGTSGSVTRAGWLNGSPMNNPAASATGVNLTNNGWSYIGVYGDGGGNAFANSYLTGTINEVLFFNQTLNAVQRQTIEGYLAAKWGRLSTLPSTHPYRSVLPSTPLFNPAQLSGLVLWMDPTDTTTLTLSGSSVTQWRDKSGLGVVFNTVNANPTYTASLINGLPGLDLTNASGFISSTTQTLTNSLTFAMVLVVRSGIGAWGSFFTHGQRDLDIALERNSISTGTTLQFQTANDNTGANITFTTNQVALYLGTMTTGTSRFFSRFGGGTTTTATATNSSTITVGLQTIRIGRSDGAENCNSFIGEIVYYNRVLTTPERQELEGYLAWKWGLLASLPSTHAYAKFRP
jgi:hypothetical protein